MKLLAPLELAYRGVNRLRRSCYRAGIFRSKRLPRPVISIGNLTIGGAGKTPTTIALARLLQEHGLRPVILSRGYGRAEVGQIAQVDSANWQQFGDEPVVMAQALPGIPVVVGAERHRAGLWFLSRDECDLFLLDDGLQHLQLARDCNIVVLASAPRWKREGASALRDVDLAIVREGANISDAAAVPLFRAALKPVSIRREDGNEPLMALHGRKVVAFSGLADNDQFFCSLRNLGADLVGSRGFRDHHDYEPKEIEELQRLAGEHKAELVTTAKDAVKLPRQKLLVLEVEMKFEQPGLLLEKIVQKCGLP